MKRFLGFIGLSLVLISMVFASGCVAQAQVENFDECVAMGYPVMESYPRQCRTPEGKTFVEEVGEMTLERALEIAENSDCTKEGTLTNETFYNPNSRTWWIDLEPNEEKPLCNPACVVSEDGSAEINWRCTGALPP